MKSRPAILALTFVTLCSALDAQCEWQVLRSSTPVQYDKFGASVDVSEGRIVVGANQIPTLFQGGNHGGAVYVFEPTAQGWAETARLTADGLEWVSAFGSDVAVSGDRIAVGTLSTEHAYVFEKGPTGWDEVLRLTAGMSSPAVTEYGPGIDIDGDTLFVFGETSFLEGVIEVHEHQGTGWVHTATLATPAPFPLSLGNHYGEQIALQGNRAVVGSRYDDEAADNGGAGYVFERDESGWALSAKLLSANIGYYDWVGSSVALDGDVVALGSASLLGNPKSNHVHVFELEDGTWQETAVFESPQFPGDEYDNFGDELALRGDLLFVSQHGHNTVFTFRRGESGWAYEDTIVASPSDPWALFGGGLAVDDELVVVGGPEWPGGGPLGSFGRVHVFRDAPPTQLPGLWPGSGSISLSSGGTQDLSLQACLPSAGELYLVLGSASGTAPGTPAGPFVLPLNPDGYLVLTATQPNTIVAGSFGVLDGDAQASAQLALPAGLDPSLAGATLHHAFVVLDVGGSPLVPYASNAVPLLLVP